jgi:hypothetical protein
VDLPFNLRCLVSRRPLMISQGFDLKKPIAWDIQRHLMKTYCSLWSYWRLLKLLVYERHASFRWWSPRFMGFKRRYSPSKKMY